MRIKTSQDRVTELMLMFARLVEANNIADRYDINRIAENILLPLFKVTFGYEHLRNLNYTEHANYPGVDIADDQARIAFQITASADNDKIKDTLQKFIRHELDKRYDRLVIYVLTKKQRSYSDKQYAGIIKDRISFDKKRDIWDYTDVIKQISTFSQPHDVRKVQDLLEEHFGHGLPFPWLIKQEATEHLFLNIVEMIVPSKLFIADLVMNRDEVIKNSFGTERALKWNSSTRDVAAEWLRQQGLRFSTEWSCHENKLLTFHDLHDEKLPLHSLIDAGTVSCEDAHRFFEIDGQINDDRERVFKGLLGRCLQNLLYHCGVQWQHKEKVFIFTENGPTPCEQEGEYFVRKDTWFGEKESTRTVFWRKMKTDNPDEIFYCKHLAFETRYHYMSGKWYLQVIPDWFFSFDGYKKNWFKQDDISWLKRNEGNKQVFSHFRYIVDFLKRNTNIGLFERPKFITFERLVSLNSAPELDDQSWNPTGGTSENASEGIDNDKTGQIDLFESVKL